MWQDPTAHCLPDYKTTTSNGSQIDTWSINGLQSQCRYLKGVPTWYVLATLPPYDKPAVWIELSVLRSMPTAILAQ